MPVAELVRPTVPMPIPFESAALFDERCSVCGRQLTTASAEWHPYCSKVCHDIDLEID